MTELRGTIQNGQVILDQPARLSDGTPVAITPLTHAGGDELPDDMDDSPEAIARRLALIERVQPWMTPDEFTEWERVRAEEKAFQLSQWDKWTKEIGEIFE